MEMAGRIGPRGGIQVEALTARRVWYEDDGGVVEGFLRVVENGRIQRAGIQADHNLELAGAINVKRRIQRVDCAISSGLDVTFQAARIHLQPVIARRYA